MALACARAAGFKTSDEPLLDGYDQRAFIFDPFGNRLEFFKGIYFFVECLAVVGAVPAHYPAG